MSVAIAEQKDEYDQFRMTMIDITERKRAEEKNNYLAAIVESSDDAIIGKSMDERIISWNKGAEQIYGFTAEEVTGKPISILVPADKQSELSDIIMKLKRGEAIEHFETTRIRKDGRTIHVSLTISPLKDSNGHIVGASTIARDITKSKQAEEFLQLANAYNRNLIEVSLDPLVTIGPDGRITDVNTATEVVTGYIRTVLVGTDFSDYFTEPKRAQAGYQQVFREGMVHDYPLEIRHHDGHITPVLFNASVYRDKSGKVIGVFAAARDITKRKLAEEKLQQASTYNRSLIEASLDPLVAIGPDGKITDVNIATEAVTGYVRTVLVGTDFSDYFTEPKRAQAGYQQVFREGMVHDYPLEIRHRDGHVTPVLYNASVYRDKAGKVVGIFAAARNITERKRAEEAMQISETRFRELFENMSNGVAIYEAVDDGSDFIFKDFNAAGQRMDKTSRENAVGKRVTEVFPGVKEMGLFDIFRQVLKTGKAEHLPTTLYKDGRISGWRENHVYKLPSGEIVAVYDDVTERQVALEKLQNERNLLRTLIDHIPGEIYAKDKESRFILCNK